MSKVNKRSLIASAVVGAFALTSQIVAADPLYDLHAEEAQIQANAAKSQSKINSIYEQTQELLAEYRQVVDETETLRVYNDHVQRLVDDQNEAIASLQRQIDSITETKQGVVPLMYKMIDTLEQFVELDIPVLVEERRERVVKLRGLMSESNVTTSEQFRQVLEAYQIENEYGSKIRAYKGTLNLGGKDITVDFFHMGRISLVAQSLDQKDAWVWDNGAREWKELGDEYLSSVTKAIRMARKQAAFDLVKLPVSAAE